MGGEVAPPECARKDVALTRFRTEGAVTHGNDIGRCGTGAVASVKKRLNISPRRMAASYQFVDVLTGEEKATVNKARTHKTSASR